jgi:hypothetical protein
MSEVTELRYKKGLLYYTNMSLEDWKIIRDTAKRNIKEIKDDN